MIGTDQLEAGFPEEQGAGADGTGAGLPADGLPAEDPVAGSVVGFFASAAACFL